MTGQLELTFQKPARPSTTMQDVLDWIDLNPEGWRMFVATIRDDVATVGRARVKRAIEDLRDNPAVQRQIGTPVKMPNAYSAYMGRILVAWYPELEPYVPLHAAKADGMVIPPCPAWARGL